MFLEYERIPSERSLALNNFQKNKIVNLKV